jgi:nucleoside-diphosphate-sugar epimerase
MPIGLAVKPATDMASGGKKVCAVTGAGGFVGGAIKRFLQNAGWRVVDWSRSPAQGVTFRLGSPVDPQLFKGTDALVHCAYDFEPRNRNEIWEINVRGSKS